MGIVYNTCEHRYKEGAMSRIKFLDVLEETKTKPMYNNNRSLEDSALPIREEAPLLSRERMERPLRSTRMAEQENATPPSLASLREKSLLRDSSSAFESGYSSRRPVSEVASAPKSMSLNSGNSIEDHRVLWTGALFVLFGGMLFLSGYWVGKTITGNVKAEKALITQSINSFQNDNMNNSSLPLSSIEQPLASTLDTIPLPQKPVKVIEPAIAEVPVVAPKKAAPKPVVTSKEYVIQVSAHSTIASARLVEDQLRTAGFSAYTSESVIGDAVFFRVRLRGFNSKTDAQDTLAKMKSQNLSKDGFVLTLE